MIDVVVVGAGPGGLAVSHELEARGVEHVVFERGDGPGHCWAHTYDSLTLHTGKHLSRLPGRALPRSAPLFVPASEFLAYLREYASSFDLPVKSRCAVTDATRRDGAWLVATESGAVRARALVVATGILSSPVVPAIASRDLFRGTVRHSVDYRRPDPYAGRRVLVIGAGNSAGEIAPELAAAGAEVTIAIRSGANVVPLTLLGIPIQYVGWAVLKLPPPARRVVLESFGRITRALRGAPPFPPGKGGPLDDVPLIGFKLVDSIRAGDVRMRGGVEGFTPSGVRFSDGTEEAFDDVVMATGYQAALGPVEGLVSRDERGFARRRDRVFSTEQPNLYFIGHHYDGTGGLNNIRLDAPAIARHIARREG